MRFGGTKFTATAAFRHAKFHQSATFYGALFQKEIDFSHSVFGARATFHRLLCRSGAQFVGTRFGGIVDFVSARFDGVVSFIGRIEGASIFFGAEPHFNFLRLADSATVVFRNADLRKARFLDTDVRDIEFTSVRWPSKGRSICVYDEIAAEEEERAVPWGRLARLYRELKQNYQDRENYGRGGAFHYREKEMLRKNPDTPLGSRVLLYLYWAISGYGERVVRPALWLAGVIVLAAVGYVALGIAPTGGGDALGFTWGGVGRSLLYSVRVVFLQRPSGFELSLWAALVQTVEMIVGPILLGLLALAVRQRVKR